MSVRTAFNLRAGAVDQAMEDGGFWHACSGCHEAEDGHETGPYSSVLKCYTGSGCYECGGIGAVWRAGFNEVDLSLLDQQITDQAPEEALADLKRQLADLGARAGLSFGVLQRACVARNVEWHGDDQPSLLFKATDLGGEVGEALNVVKKLAREREGWPGSRATVDDLADELADVVICAMHVANCEGIDLGAAVVRKFNATSQKLGLNTILLATLEGGAA